MTKTKITPRKSQEDKGCVRPIYCRFPGCGQKFAFHQGMIRHMRRKHHVSVRDFRSGEMSQGADAGAPMFSAERHLAEAFSSASVGSEEEALLAVRTLDQIMDGIPTLCTLAPIVIVDDEDAADEPSSYPEPDSADEEINLPEDASTSNPDPPQPREPRRAVTGGKVRRMRRCLRCVASVSCVLRLSSVRLICRLNNLRMFLSPAAVPVSGVAGQC